MTHRYHKKNSFIKRIMSYWRRRATSKVDLVELLTQAFNDKVIDQDTLDMIQRVVQVTDLRVRDVMIPKAKIVLINHDDTPEKFLTAVIDSAHSRFPVVDGEQDEVVGILFAKDILQYFNSDSSKPFNMHNTLRPAVFIPESKRLNVLLAEFRANRNHMAIVVDEYGGVSGLVTIEDVLEQIVGNIEDEHDIGDNSSLILKHGDDEYIAKALTTLEELNDYFGTEYDEANTVGGLVIKHFGKVPKRGESITINGLLFTLLHVDSRRIHLLKIRRLEHNETEQDAAITEKGAD